MVQPARSEASRPVRSLARGMRFARMAGTSVAGPGAAAWVTDFLNAAYHEQPPDERRVSHLRLAFGIVTTRWHLIGRRMGLRDIVAVHRAFGHDRFWAITRSRRGRLSGDELMAGAARLLGAWFPDAWADDSRRAYGLAFRDAPARAAFRPESRMRHAVLGPLTPPTLPPDRQTWSTYPPVPLPSGPRAVELLMRPERWPDIGSALGRFTPLRAGGLPGQTFEIELVARAVPHLPAITRGYVTATQLETAGSPGLARLIDGISDGLGEPAVPPGANVLAACELTTHAGHPIGAARSRLLVWEERDGRAFVRDIASWDPLFFPEGTAFRHGGREAQHAFWGKGAPEDSMLHQLALAVA